MSFVLTSIVPEGSEVKLIGFCVTNCSLLDVHRGGK